MLTASKDLVELSSEQMKALDEEYAAGLVDENENEDNGRKLRSWGGKGGKGFRSHRYRPSYLTRRCYYDYWGYVRCYYSYV